MYQEKPPTVVNGPGKRLNQSFRTARDYLRRSIRHGVEPAWTRSMTVATLVAFVLSLAISPIADVAAIELVRSSRGTWWVEALRAVTDIGRSHWYLVPAILIVLAVGLADWSTHGSRGRARLSYIYGQAAFAFAAVAGSGILVNIAKFLIGRPRPRLMDEVGPYGFDPFGFDYRFHSYPSGHSTTVGAVALILMLWFPRARPAILVAALVLGVSRIAALAHYPSDIIAGLALGFLFSLYLARWLAARGAVFRILPGQLFPVLRHARVKLFSSS